MATAQLTQMGPFHHKNDNDMESLFDFNQSTTLTTPSTPSAPSSYALTPRQNTDSFSNNAPSPYDSTEDRQVFSAPSHDYDRYNQQTGYASGPIARIPITHTDSFDPSNAFIGGGGGFNSGIDDMNDFAFGNTSWSTGLDLDADVNMDFTTIPQPAMLSAMPYPHSMQARSRSQEFVDPSSIAPHEQPQRIWPGMHQEQAQQAAMAKAQAQAQAQAQIHAQQQQRMHFEAQKQHQQQQMRMAQQQQLEVKHNASKSRASSFQQDHTEESITRLLNQMRQNSAVSSMSDDDLNGGMLPHVSRMRKEEEEMDEDERLLASEEGKKLSSKERRQLRNKVSARAFRSRRKEYISQLEGEVAVKAQECNDLKTSNRSLAEENTRYRSLIETMLRHPSYMPFIEEFSKDPAVIGGASSIRLPGSAMAPASAAAAPNSARDTPVDVSMLNINNAGGNTFSVPSNAGMNFQTPRYQ